MSNRDRNILSAFYLCFVAAVAGLALLLVSGCEHGSLHKLPPDVDVCDLEGVEECAPDCEVCLDRDRYLLIIENAKLYGFKLGVESVVCETPDPDCEDDVDDDCEDDEHKNVHKNCRGRGHSSLGDTFDCDDEYCDEVLV